MRIFFLTRPVGIDGGLNGGHILTQYFVKLLAPYFDCYHLSPSGEGYRGEGHMPELLDIQAYSELDRLVEEYNIGINDLVLNAEYAYAPYFYLRGIPASLIVHSCWVWRDGTAHIFEKFLPFITSALCPTMETKGLFQAKGIRSFFMPYPVDESIFSELRGRFGDDETYNSEDTVLWVGRAGYHKGSDLFLSIVEALPDLKFLAFSSTELENPGLSNLTVKVKTPRQECVDAFRRCRTFLLTSNQEVYTTVLIEAGLAGCNIATSDCFGTYHVFPGAKFFKAGDLDSAVSALEEVASAEPGGFLEFFERKFSSSMVDDLWLPALPEIWKHARGNLFSSNPSTEPTW